MAAIQLNFTLRTSSNCKTVHLLGSWDNYNGQLPLSKDSSKPGAWKGTFRFQGATLKQGQRYWYYYIIDGHHASHDPARQFTTEPTTGRNLNILDIPAGKPGASQPTSKRHSRHASSDIPKGRALSPSKIVSPKPFKPNQTRHLTAAEYAQHPTVEELANRFNHASLESSSSEEDSDDSSDDESDSDAASDVPSLSSSRSTASRASSVSSVSSCCTCNRFGITRSGDRVKLDCGGSRCGYSDADSCSSDSDGDHHEIRTTRRQGIVVRT
jgi:hypothetical protein